MTTGKTTNLWWPYNNHAEWYKAHYGVENKFIYTPPDQETTIQETTTGWPVMDIFRYFKEWKQNREEKKSFCEMWDEDMGKTFKDSTENTRSYHRNMAYEIYQVHKALEEIKDKIK